MGIILYEMLHGNSKHPTKIETKVPDLNKVTNNQMHTFWRETRSIDYSEENVSQDGVDLLDKMLQYSPRDRITMEEVMKDIWVISP